MDLLCALCAEPWDSWHVREDMDAEAGWEAGDPEPRPSRVFRQGGGCPSCQWGAKLPIREGQVFEAVGPAQVITIDGVTVEVAAGDLVKVVLVDYEAPGDPWHPIIWIEPFVRFIFGVPAGLEADRCRVIGSRRLTDGSPEVPPAGSSGWTPGRDPGQIHGIRERTFRRTFQLVQGAEDAELAEQIRYDAALSACAASDEDPLSILAERGFDLA